MKVQPKIWIKRSKKIAERPGYLDDLQEIYPIHGKERIVEEEAEKAVRKAYESHNKLKLIESLIKLEKFPIDNPYVSLLKNFKKFGLKSYPKTIKEISKELYDMKLNMLLHRCKEPKKTSRRYGPVFRDWLKKHYKFLSEEEFEKSNRGSIFLNGGDKKLKTYANNNLDLKYEKGLDFVGKKNGTYFVGEAKLISTSGGTQNASFKEVVQLIKNKSGKAIKIGVMDGYIWVDKNCISNIKKSIHKKSVCLSAFLFKKFIKTL